jgi:hypothetical protein
MSEQRPYDTNQLQRLTEHMLQEGSRTVHHPADIDDEAVAAEAGPLESYENPYPSVFSEVKTAVRGLGRVFSAKGRAELAEEKKERSNVLNHVIDRVANPRQTEDATEKTGWVGTHRREVEIDQSEAKTAVQNEETEDFSKLGKTLLKKPRGASTGPNMLRPATHSEISADKRIDRERRKALRTRNLEQWLHKSYPGQIDNNPGYRLSGAERRHMRSVAKKAHKLDRQAATASTKMNLATSTSNFIRYYLEAKKYDLNQLANRIPYGDEVKRSARALGDEIIDRHYESWDLSKEQAQRLADVSIKAGKVALGETIDTAKFAARGGKYAGSFYADAAKGAADIYWQAAKRAAGGVAKGARKLYQTTLPKK